MNVEQLRHIIDTRNAMNGVPTEDGQVVKA